MLRLETIAVTSIQALDSTEINTALLALGGLVITLGLFSGAFKQRFFLSDPLIALFIGIILGPVGLGLLDLNHWGHPEGILKEGARLAIAIQLMGIALRLPKKYPLQQGKLLAVLLGLIMPLMWLISGLLVFLILGVPIWVALLIGAVITPTDPVVSTSVVTGKVAERNLPERIRYSLSMESAANDGLAYPFVYLPILMLTKPAGEAIVHWVTKTLLWEVGAALVIGGLWGYGAGRLLRWAEAKDTTEKPSFLAFTVGLSLVVLASVKLMGGDGILAVFVAGMAFDQVVGGTERSQEGKVQEAIDRFFTLYIFVMLGLAIPWQAWLELGWRGPLLVVAILLLRRIPAMLAVRPWLGQLRSLSDTLFIGWFGPIGAAALFYAFLSKEKTGLDSPWTVASLMICASLVVHGVTAVPLAKRYAHHAQKHRESPPEAP